VKNMISMKNTFWYYIYKTKIQK